MQGKFKMQYENLMRKTQVNINERLKNCLVGGENKAVNFK